MLKIETRREGQPNINFVENLKNETRREGKPKINFVEC